jgi:hypothetical protein
MAYATSWIYRRFLLWVGLGAVSDECELPDFIARCQQLKHKRSWGYGDLTKRASTRMQRTAAYDICGFIGAESMRAIAMFS